MEGEGRESFGVLVGWTSQDLGQRVVLALQTYERGTWEEHEDPSQTRVIMTKSQAAVLANYLLKAAGTTPPPRRRSWLERLLG